MNEILTGTDSYKVSQWKAYPEGMTRMYSYLESRGGQYDETVFFGLQYFLVEYLRGHAFNSYGIVQAEDFWKAHFGRDDVFNVKGWQRLLEKHKGLLPIRIKAVPEGSIVPTHNVLMTIENTDDEFPWLVGWLETLLMHVWYPMTVATQSYHIRQTIKMFMEQSGADLAGLDFKCHDFGYRGVPDEAVAGLGGAAHLVNFMGTDTVAGINFLQKYYDGGMSGFSIPATEHSVITAFGDESHEIDAFTRWLDQYPTGMIACVSDTYNVFRACSDLWGGVLKDRVMERDGVLVVRPDSGDYLDVVPQVLNLLGEKFGYITNSKGFKVLDPHVRVIQGDGMNPETIGALYQRLGEFGWSAENLAVGSGGALLQKVNRDTQKFAIKASEVVVNGETRAIRKEPITDPGKNSKRGRLILTDGQTYSNMDQPRDYNALKHQDELVTVFEHGELTHRQTLADIRERIRAHEAA